jgi:hypothetical protein
MEHATCTHHFAESLLITLPTLLRKLFQHSNVGLIERYTVYDTLSMLGSSHNVIGCALGKHSKIDTGKQRVVPTTLAPSKT